MAQVYQFVDQNGETRLFAEITPDPPGTFNGGTITTPLTIDVAALATAGGLTITGTDGGNVNRLVVNFLHQLLELTGDGTLNISSDDTMNVTIQGTAGTDSLLQVSSAGGTASSVVSAGGGDSVTLAGITGGGSRVRVLNGGGISSEIGGTFQRFAYHAAPADGSLAAGDCALWFDQTDGAGKLMVKAKTANGTVATGSVTLT